MFRLESGGERGCGGIEWKGEERGVEDGGWNAGVRVMDSVQSTIV